MCLSGRGGGGDGGGARRCQSKRLALLCSLSFFEIESPVGCPLMKLQRWWPRQRLVAGQSISDSFPHPPPPTLFLLLQYRSLLYFPVPVVFYAVHSYAYVWGWNAQGLAVPVPILHSFFFWFLIVSYLPGLEIGFFGGPDAYPT